MPVVLDGEKIIAVALAVVGDAEDETVKEELVVAGAVATTASRDKVDVAALDDTKADDEDANPMVLDTASAVEVVVAASVDEIDATDGVDDLTFA